jgi:2-oxoglutarate dehydrogenase E1 component
MGLNGTLNGEYIDSQYTLWKDRPENVTPEWRRFFEGFDLGAEEGGTAACTEDQALLQSRVDALIHAYRDIGHLLSCLDPLESCPVEHPLLSLSAFKLKPEDLETQFHTESLGFGGRTRLGEIIRGLRETYSRSIGVEYMHIQDPGERKWLADRMEPSRNKPALGSEEKIRILHKLIQATLFEQFLNRKYPGQTRFSLEGAEVVIPMLDTLLHCAAGQGMREIVLGMAHRGRLNVQANIQMRPYEDIFREFEGNYDPVSLVGWGDVKYHSGYLGEVPVAGNEPLRMILINNASHLESVNPVVEGLARARQELAGEGGEKRVLPLLIHGDAGFAGQGIVAETLNMSRLEGYATGGTFHIVINNQIGYTTIPRDARSTRYSTDIGKMLMIPIFHVHGEDPEAAVHVVRLAAGYRAEFGKDVVIDLVCYRRYGHNEGDEPYFTQPIMYNRIKDREALHETYGRKLIGESLISKASLEEIRSEIDRCLETSFNTVREERAPFPAPRFFEGWEGMRSSEYSRDPVETGVSEDRLTAVARKLYEAPEGFSLHPKLERLFEKRLESIEKGIGIDWAFAEALAFGSLLSEGTPVRLSGQDSRRGTFSQRHAALSDTRTGETIYPLARLNNGIDAPLYIFNSPLSEAGVLGFEYGYSLARPETLVMWEAQFGDFINNAQMIVDLYIASGETKWQRPSGLVLLLPHGLEGLGPEHSSARPERFLQLCAEDNMEVCYPSTPAQYFHLLRRQVRRNFRKPLVVMTPKSLLRHPFAVSAIQALVNGSFREVLADDESRERISRILICSGKIYYELLQRRNEAETLDAALIRLEQFHPFPEGELAEALEKYGDSVPCYWVQEEPENMGGWHFIRPKIENLIGRPVSYIGRKAAPSPATGFPALYRKEQAEIIRRAFSP